MPEGDTIHRLADRITERLAGHEVERSTFRHPSVAMADLYGARLVGATASGKHLLIRFEGPGENAPRTLHIHLRMDGEVRFGGAFEEAEWRRHVELRFDGGRRLTGVALPVVAVIATADEETVVGHLGPDVVATAIDLDDATIRLTRDGERALAATLLDQRVFAGFGNVYAIEIPFLCGVSPFQTAASVAGVHRLLEVAVALIRWNADRDGRNTTGRNLNRADSWIESRAQRNCPVCGERIERKAADRSPWRRRTAWCPACQPAVEAAAVDEARVRHLLALHPIRKELREWKSG